MFLSPLALLYYVSFSLLAGLAGFVLARRPRSRLSRIFFLLALSLLLWKLTLFLEVRVASPSAQLWLGRANFAVIAIAVYLALWFVQVVIEKQMRVSAVLFIETLLLAGLTLLTSLISASERIEEGSAVTTYGPLFGLYLAHVLGYLLAALIVAFRGRRQTRDKAKQAQLLLIGVGLLAMGGISAVTNALLPYQFQDFRFCDAGPLSTVLFASAIAYAVFVHQLFGLRLVLRTALVYGVLLAFVLGAYSSGVFVLSQYLTEGSGKMEQFLVLFLAFSFDPLRRFLEGKVDALLFGAVVSWAFRSRKQRYHTLVLLLLFIPVRAFLVVTGSEKLN